MRLIKGLILVIGVLALLMGSLWIGQGTGIIMWPKSSFMLAERSWAYRGAVLDIVGLAMIWFARR